MMDLKVEFVGPLTEWCLQVEPECCLHVSCYLAETKAQGVTQKFRPERMGQL